MSEPDRRTPEGLRRLVAFADAVVAIAGTLLVLPLVDITHELSTTTTAGRVIGDNLQAIITFLISFAVIWLLWRNHHRMLEYFRGYDSVIITLRFVWLLSMVVIPFATALVGNGNIRYANVLYIGLLGVSVMSLVFMRIWADRHPELLESGEDVHRWSQGVGGVGNRDPGTRGAGHRHHPARVGQPPVVPATSHRTAGSVDITMAGQPSGVVSGTRGRIGYVCPPSESSATTSCGCPKSCELL